MDKLAVSERMALLMFYDAGLLHEGNAASIHNKIKDLPHPTQGYVYPDDVQKLINSERK